MAELPHQRGTPASLNYREPLVMNGSKHRQYFETTGKLFSLPASFNQQISAFKMPTGQPRALHEVLARQIVVHLA
jgi:hypothetical protein